MVSSVIRSAPYSDRYVSGVYTHCSELGL